MHKYLLIAVFALFTLGCSHLPWADEPKDEETDCQELLEQGASQAEYFGCLSQQEQD